MRSDKNSKAAGAIQAAYGLFRPLLGPRACRFHPSCSEYSFQSFKRHGLFKGALLSAARICRCHPWNPGGYDPVPLLAQVPYQRPMAIERPSVRLNTRETN